MFSIDIIIILFFFFFQAEDGIRDRDVTGVQTCALPISPGLELEAVTPGTREDYLYDDLIGLEVSAREHSRLKAVLERSEERRVGKEWRCRWWREHLKEKSR